MVIHLSTSRADPSNQVHGRKLQFPPKNLYEHSALLCLCEAKHRTWYHNQRKRHQEQPRLGYDSCEKMNGAPDGHDGPEADA